MGQEPCTDYMACNQEVSDRTAPGRGRRLTMEPSCSLHSRLNFSLFLYLCRDQTRMLEMTSRMVQHAERQASEKREHDLLRQVRSASAHCHDALLNAPSVVESSHAPVKGSHLRSFASFLPSCRCFCRCKPTAMARSAFVMKSNLRLVNRRLMIRLPFGQR